MTPNRQLCPRRGRWLSPDPFFHVLNGNLQGDPNTITQAGNLYMYVMHNPVKWLDPTGLFAWNEANDHWFNIQSEVWGAGGSIDFHNGFINVSIFGVTVRFYSHQDGVQWGNYRSCVRVRADLFYRTIVNAATEMIFLGGHRAFDTFNAYHLHIAMFMSPDRFDYLSQNGNPSHLAYFGTKWGGVRFAFLSGAGTPGFSWSRGAGLFAESGVNLNNYFERSNLQFFNHIHTGTGKIERLFNAHTHFSTYYSRNFFWGAIPIPMDPWSANSTSVALGLLNAAGLDPGFTTEQQRRAIGRGSTIPSGFFGVR